jgi:hypothetical protein
MENRAETRAIITMLSTTLSMRVWNVMSKIESLGVTRSDLARSRRMTAKCRVAKLKLARASQVTVREIMTRRIRIMAAEVFRGIVSADLPNAGS